MVVVLPISWTYCMMIYSVRRGESLTRQAMHKRYHRIVESLGIDATVHALRHPYVKPMTKYSDSGKSQAISTWIA